MALFSNAPKNWRVARENNDFAAIQLPKAVTISYLIERLQEPGKAVGESSVEIKECEFDCHAKDRATSVACHKGA